jgi:hypothetical protein
MASWAKTRGLSVNARSEYVQTMRKRYRAAEGRKAKSTLLDELVGVAGFDRKYAITLMNQPSPRRAAAGKKRSGRPRAYQHCLSVIEVAWEALDYCCAERLHPQLLPLATALAHHAEVELTREAREELARISRATLARRLAELPRAKPRLMRAGPHPSRILKSQVQVDRYRWNEDRPGALEVDLVEHNGGSTGGHYACTLSVVDVVSGWSARKGAVLVQGVDLDEFTGASGAFEGSLATGVRACAVGAAGVVGSPSESVDAAAVHELAQHPPDGAGAHHDAFTSQ